MNPIEHVWGWIKHKLSNLKVKPKNITQLKTDIETIWNQITLEQIQRLYNTMPNRLSALMVARGKNTRF